MALFIDRRKLNAATRSMDQFLPVVRSIFQGKADDETVEAATVFLYAQLAQSVFGNRFANVLRRGLLNRSKFMRPTDLRARLRRFERDVAAFEQAAGAVALSRSPESKFENYVKSVVQALLHETGARSDDMDLLKETFTRFEEAVREIKRHLVGLKQQNFFVMR